MIQNHTLPWNKVDAPPPGFREFYRDDTPRTFHTGGFADILRNKLMDGGCLHMIPRSQRPSYVLIIVGFSKYGALGLTRDEIEQLFTKWTLLAADPAATGSRVTRPESHHHR